MANQMPVVRSEMNPENMRALADRIDFDQQWRRPFTDELTQAEADRRDAGVWLRRYASDHGVFLEELKKGAEYMRGFKFERCSFGTYHRGCGTREWHSAINQYADEHRKTADPLAMVEHRASPMMMYTALKISDELPRAIMLFERERKGENPTHYKMCAHDPRPATPLPDNHLTCLLGKSCRECAMLKAIDANDRMTPEAKDEAKAWTCVTHVLLVSNQDSYFEQILFDKSDAAFEERLIDLYREPPEPGLEPQD